MMWDKEMRLKRLAIWFRIVYTGGPVSFCVGGVKVQSREQQKQQKRILMIESHVAHSEPDFELALQLLPH